MGALPLRGAPTDLATSQRGTTYNYTYDSKGNATALEAKNPDGDMSLKSTAEYTSNGAFPAKTTDQEGIETTYNYDPNSGLLMSAQDSSTTTSYTYDENTNQLTSVTAKWDSYEDEYATNSYSYTAGTGRNLTQISHNGTNYNIEYDKFNNKTNSLVGNQSLAQYSYDSNNGILQSVTYGNGNTVSYAYDNYGNTSVQKYNGIEAFKWFSDRSGSVIRQSDFINQLETSYDYDTTGRLTRQTTLDTSKASSTDRTKYMVEYGYDLNNNITRLVNITPNGTKTFNYTYGKDNFLEKFTIGTNRSVDYTYDGLGRLTGSTITTARPIETSYSYKLSNRNSSGQTQYRTTKINNEVIDGEEYRYTYDDSGNITKIESVTVENGNRVGTTLYVYDYDSFGQLIYERDYIQNLSRHYDYDEGGNLLNETINYYDGSNGGVPTRTEDINYRYTDTNWTDKMTSYKGQTITYDEIGNPLSYRDGMTMTWQNGRQLASLQKGNNNIQYSYDSEGIRVSKTINGEKCTFEYLNGMLLYETRGDKYFHYYYDSNGTLCAVSYRLTPNDDENIYYYTHNWRGDIVGIYTDAGDLTAKYTYDSWGNVTSITDGNGNAITSATHIGNLNPFRYRGYYMDTETGMYYLMSRYYDPVTHRFVNADGYFQTGLGILDGNMNAYCKNNPVNYFDPFGTDSSKSMQKQMLQANTNILLFDVLCAAKIEAGYSVTFADYTYEFSIGPFDISSYSKTSYSLNEPNNNLYVDFNLSEFSANMHNKFLNYDLSYNIDQKSIYGLLGVEYDNCVCSVGLGRQYKDKASSLYWDVTTKREGGWSDSYGYTISISDENSMNIAKGVAVVGVTVASVLVLRAVLRELVGTIGILVGA